MPVNALITEVSFSLIDPEDDNYRNYLIQVQWRGDNLYAIMQSRYCYGTDGSWDWEPRPSERDGEWLSTHRFPYDQACAIAAREAPVLIGPNGMTAAQYLAAKGQQ